MNRKVKKSPKYLHQLLRLWIIWFPDPDPQKQQHADAEGAKKQWEKPDVFLSM
jgi:hypothetical protein